VTLSWHLITSKLVAISSGRKPCCGVSFVQYANASSTVYE